MRLPFFITLLCITTLPHLSFSSFPKKNVSSKFVDTDDFENPVQSHKIAVGHAIAAIEQNDMGTLQKLVDSGMVEPDATSSQGFTLIAIAKRHKRDNMASYLEQKIKEKKSVKAPAVKESGMLGVVIEYIEKGNLAKFKQYVPSQITPYATSINGHSLEAIARYHHKKDIAEYIENILKEHPLAAPLGEPSQNISALPTAPGGPVQKYLMTGGIKQYGVAQNVSAPENNPNDIGEALQAIEDGGAAAFAIFKILVPAKVAPTAKSTKGYSLLEVAKFHKKEKFIKYLESL